MTSQPELLSPEKIIKACLELQPDSDVVRAAQRGVLNEVDQVQNANRDPALSLLFQSLYAQFNYGPSVMRALARPDLLVIDGSDSQRPALQLKPDPSPAT